MYPHVDFSLSRKIIKGRMPVRIKEGEFRYVDRDATPEFIDFYINQVIALVLTFH